MISIICVGMLLFLAFISNENSNKRPKKQFYFNEGKELAKREKNQGVRFR